MRCKETRLGLGEEAHMGGHMGLVLNKNSRACNPLPPTDRWWSRSVYLLAPLSCVNFYELMFINSVKSANMDFPSRPKHIFITAFFYIAVNNKDRKNSGIDEINEI